MKPMRLLTGCLALALIACMGPDSYVELKGRRFRVEIADDEAERARGLMFRDHLPDDHGMLFVFDDDAPRAFWMKNTRIPLDILYFDGERRFVSGQYRVPTCRYGGNQCPSYPSEGNARFVLELNAGVGAELDLKPGDPIVLPQGLNGGR